MIITVDSWFVPVGVNFVGYFLTYNTDTKRFAILNTGVASKDEKAQASKLLLTVSTRGNKLPNELLVTSCEQTTLLSFFAQLEYPFAYVTETVNNASCGFDGPVPPPPTTPPPAPPVCDLVVGVTSTPIVTRNGSDGTITATITTTVTGDFVLQLYNDSINSAIIVQNVVIGSPTSPFTFIGLPKGTYRVEAKSISFSCFYTAVIIVADFAFNEKYFFNFCEQRFGLRKIRLSIKKIGFLGTTTEITVAGGEVASIDYPSVDSQNKFFTLMGSECNIQLIANAVFNLQDVYTDTEQQYLLELSFQSTGDPIWSGYIIPDSAREPFKSFPYVVELSATDGVKLLEDIDFDIIDGRLTFLQGLKFALDKTNIKLGFKTMCDIINASVSNNALISGLVTNIFGLSVSIGTGSWKINGITYNKTFSELVTFASITRKKIILLYVKAENNSIYSVESIESILPRTPRLPVEAVLLATIFQTGSVLEITREPLFIDDTFTNHTFDVKRFIKEDGEFTDCYTVIDYICKQFTCQIKQSNGYWIVENIGYKGRDVVLLESKYDNDLNVIYVNQLVNLSIDVSCNKPDIVLGGGSLSIGSGHKKETVIQKIGFPEPVFANFGFEKWTNGTPDGWLLSQPLDYFNRGSKFDRFYNPSTGEITIVESGFYYFNMIGTNFNNAFVPKRYIPKKVTSSAVPVFNQEIITLNFQAIVNNPTFGLPIFSFIYFNLGNYRFVNFFNGSEITPLWVKNPQDRDCFYFFINNDDLKPPIGDTRNVTIETLPAPMQAYLNISFTEHFLGTKELILYSNERFSPRQQNLQLGFDNFKITKKSPVNATVISEDKVEIFNKNKFSTIPDPFEVFFTDVNNAFRTDGIKTVAGIATAAWKRKSIDEAETIVKIIARELLSQYQESYKMFEGDIIANNLTIRAIFNLPSLNLFKFVPTSMTINLLKCTANVNIVQIYAKEGSNSGPIGGGGGGQGGGQVDGNGFVLGFNNFIFTDGNNNVLGSDVI